MATADFYKRCAPAISTTIRECGTLTACDLVIPAPSDLDNIFKSNDGDWRIIKALLAAKIDLATYGVELTPFRKFLMAHNAPRKMTILDAESGLARIQPFFMAERKVPINNQYWTVTSGAAPSGAECSGLGANWRVVVTSPFGIPADADWFAVNEHVYITGMSAGGSKTETQWKILSAEVSGDNVILCLGSLNSASYLPDVKLTAPTNGVLFRGVNNVTNYESHCPKIPGLIQSNLQPFWFQWSRGPIICEDDLTKQYIDMLRQGNDLYARFYDLPLTKYTQQAIDDWSRRFCDAILRNKPLPGQSLEKWQSDTDGLEKVTITDFMGQSRCIGYRANSVGLYEQWHREGRVHDAQGAKLNIISLARALYKMLQVRKSAMMKNPDQFDIFCPSPMVPLFQRAMVEYWKARGISNYDKILDPKYVQTGSLGIKFRTFELDWPDVQIHLMTDPYFDDYLDMAQRHADAISQPSFANIGRQLWIIPWQYNWTAILASKRVVNESGSLQERARINAADMCKMSVDKIKTTMTSTAWGAVCELAAAGIVIENLGDGVPDWQTENGPDYDENTCQEDGSDNVG